MNLLQQKCAKLPVQTSRKWASKFWVLLSKVFKALFLENYYKQYDTHCIEQAFEQLSKIGLDLKDAEGYLDAIGQEQTAKIKSKAAIEKAEADRDAFIQEQECQKNAMDKKYQVDTSIADFEKEFKTKEVKEMR